MVEASFSGYAVAIMNIQVRVIPGAKRTLVKEEGPGVYKVYLKAPAVDGKANKALGPVLAEYFGIRKKDVLIIKGLKSRQKTITLGENFRPI